MKKNMQKKGLKILSLFDGISCARVALERVGISVEAYYSSEIDKYAMQISNKNYPDIVQVGSVTDIKGEVLHLSGVYDMLREYDIDIQNKLSEQEMLYWLNEDFSISAKIGTQITNADSPESASLQRIEEIWFSRSGVGDIIKTQNLIGSRIVGENGDTQTQELLLQCGEWGYVYRSDTRNQEENIVWADGEKIKTRKHREDTPISNQTVQQSSITNNTIGTDKERNVEAEKPQEISIGIKEQKEWGASTAPNRKEYARSKVQNVSFPLQTKNDNERITDREWIQLSIRKEMETTMVRTPKSIDIFLGTFEIMCGGSPCQDLSIAKKNRQGLDGERSGLFWEYVRILKEVKPKYFILENVNSMPKEAKAIITETLGVEPIMINAALVSAQNRKRLFWTNIPNVTLPEDKGILLKDILEKDVDEKYNVPNYNTSWSSDKPIDESKEKYKTLRIGGDVPTIRLGQIGKGGQGGRIYSPDGKSVGLSALGGGVGAKTGLYAIKPYEAYDYYNDKIVPSNKAKTLGTNPQSTTAVAGQLVAVPVALRNRGDGKKPEYNGTGKANSMTTVQTDSMVCIVKEATKKGYVIATDGQSIDLSFPTSKTRRGRVGDKVKNLMTSQNIGVFTDSIIRKLTPIECERLQGLEDNFTEGVSNTQRYKALGNAFNVDVVSHILSFIPHDKN
jgi:DNA (cytosine-5)-methyltransferase 3A